MQNVSSAFKEAAASRMRELALKVILKLGTDTYELGASDIVGGSLSVVHACMGNDFALGAVIASDCNISLDNRTGRWDNVVFDGAIIQPYSGFVTHIGLEYVLLGTFIVDAPGKPSKSVTLKASDMLILLDKPFSEVSIGFPATNAQILAAVCSVCHIPLSPAAISKINMSYQVTERPKGELSCRDIVGQIALMAYGFARMTRTGELEIVEIPRIQLGYTGVKIMQTPENRYSFEETSDLLSISGLKYGQDYTFGTSEYELVIKPLDILQENVQMILAHMFSCFQTAGYQGFCSLSPCDPSIDAGDVIKHITREGKTVLSVVGKHSFTHGGKSALSFSIKSAAANKYRSQNDKRLASIATSVKETNLRLSNYQLASAHMSDLLGLMMGTYRTEETMPDGSVVYLFHDKATLSESINIWKFNGQAFGFSSDGGQTWGGLSVDSNLVVRAIQTIRINAEMVDIGQGTIQQYIDGVNETQNTRLDAMGMTITNNTMIGNETVSSRVATLTNDYLSLTNQFSALKSGGGNLIRNSQYGSADIPDSAWWYTGLAWGVAELRGIRWGTMASATIKWQMTEAGDV